MLVLVSFKSRRFVKLPEAADVVGFAKFIMRCVILMSSSVKLRKVFSVKLLVLFVEHLFTHVELTSLLLTKAVTNDGLKVQATALYKYATVTNASQDRYSLPVKNTDNDI